MNKLIILVALGLASISSFTRRAGRAQDVAPVTTWSEVAAVGTCPRCARPTWPVYAEKNYAVHVSHYHANMKQWDGCFDCLYEILCRQAGPVGPRSEK